MNIREEAERAAFEWATAFVAQELRTLELCTNPPVFSVDHVERGFLVGVEWLAKYLSEKVMPIGYGIRVFNELESPERPTS
jgi:hypothetical protein